MRTIEVCCGSLADAIEANEGGAARIELCSALELGGVTPSYGLIKAVQTRCPELDINVIIRPRGGNFVYTAEEITQMLLDIAQCRTMGVHGVVIGALTKEGQVDMVTCRLMMKAAKDVTGGLPSLSVTFHRAFDVCRDQMSALEDVITLRCDRLLTSGGRSTALQGAEQIAALVRRSASRIIVMPGCGITPDNIAEIEEITEASEYHSTARGAAQTVNVYVNKDVDFGETEPQRQTSREVVAALVGQ